VVAPAFGGCEIGVRLRDFAPTLLRPTNSSFFQFTARNSDFQFKKQFRILFPQKQFRLNSSFAGKELATRKNNA
jgi:hypothetical protein